MADPGDDPRAIAYRALPLGHLPQLRYQPGGRLAVREGLRMVAWGQPGPWSNRVVALGATPSPERVLELAGEFFGSAPGGWSVLVERDAAHPVETALRARGWQGEDDHPAMVLPAIPPPDPPPAELTIRRVRDERELEDWYTAASPGARAPDEPPSVDYNRVFIRSLSVALDPEIALFAGYVAGRPVASSALYVIDGVAEIGAVATWPTYRRHGYGAAMTWAAIAEGAARGCTAAALRSSEMGYSVYRGMGFTHVCTFRSYVPPGIAEAARER